MSAELVEAARLEPLTCIPPRERSAAKLILILLAHHQNRETGRCDPSVATLAEGACCDRKRVVRALANLREAGFVTVINRPGRPSAYRVNLAPPWGQPHHGVSPTTGSGEQVDPAPPRGQVPSPTTGSAPPRGQPHHGTPPSPVAGPPPSPATGLRTGKNRKEQEGGGPPPPAHGEQDQEERRQRVAEWAGSRSMAATPEAIAELETHAIELGGAQDSDTAVAILEAAYRAAVDSHRMTGTGLPRYARHLASHIGTTSETAAGEHDAQQVEDRRQAAQERSRRLRDTLLPHRQALDGLASQRRSQDRSDFTAAIRKLETGAALDGLDQDILRSIWEEYQQTEPVSRSGAAQ